MPTTTSSALVLVSRQNGIVVIPAPTPLTRLNYFDGKFLRASDLKAEQDYLRQLVAQSNQAGGAGVAHGFDLTLGSGDTLGIGQGLAIDPSGRVLLLPQGTSVSVQELIDKSRDLQQLFGTANVVRAGSFETCELPSSTPPVSTTQASNLYLIVISPADALCGEEDVYGRLCEEACATSTDRPFAVEGLIVRAIPLVLQTPLPAPKAIALTQTHLRSRVASAYFEDERRRVASLISKAGLEQQTWCLGADAAGGSGVPIGVIARAGSTTVFLDPWIARRERIDSPAKRYWQWRMMMRPWDVFLAQVLQFQCQLNDLFRRTPMPGGEVDPCGGAHGAISEAANTISELARFYESTSQRFTVLNVNLDEALTFTGGLSRLTALNDRLVSVSQGLAALPRDRFLINGGIVELPSAGYLPVVPGAAATINQQVRRMMGEGIDLRFCVVRPDYVAHALEEAQHMERISLLQGLDDPQHKPEVDILVPNGEVLEQKLLSPGNGFEASVDLNQMFFSPPAQQNYLIRQPPAMNFRGAARTETLPTGGGAFYLSCDHQVNLYTESLDVGSSLDSGYITSSVNPARRVALGEAWSSEVLMLQPSRLGLWVSLRCDSNVFNLSRGDTANFNASAIVARTNTASPMFDIQFNGVIQITQESRTTGTSQTVRGHIENAQVSVRGDRFRNAGARITALVDLNVTATLTGSAIQIRLDYGNQTFVLTANWGKQPLEVSASITEELRVGKGVELPISSLAAAKLNQNADVLSARNASHVQALAALDVIAKILKDANFADAKARQLFPPPPKPTDELIVRGTMDWVLFHRRRNRRCAPEICVPPVAPPRRYAVFLIELEDVGQLGAIREALHVSTTAGNALLQRAGLKSVDIVEFAGGAATLVSAPDDILQDWQAKGPGNLLEYAAIASTGLGADEADVLAQSRLNRIELVVSPVSHPVQNAVFEVLPAVPGPLVVPNTDGAIVMVTAQEVTTTCHTVYWAANDEKLSAARSQIRAGNIPEAIKRLTLLGNVQFQRDQVVVSDAQSLNNVATKWKELGGSAFHSAVAMATSATPAEETLYKEQTKLIRNAIRQAMGQPALDPLPGVERTGGALPTQCPAFSIITVNTPATVCHTVYRAESDEVSNAARTKIQSGDISGALKNLTPLGNVQFEQDQLVVSDAQSLADVVAKWTTLGGTAEHSALAFLSSRTADEITRLKAETKLIRNAIRQAMGQGALTPDPGLAPTTATLPTSCPAFSIITVRPAPSVCHSVYRARNQTQYFAAVKDLQSLGTGDIQQRVVQGRELILLGDALFDEQTANVFGDGQALNDLKQKWDQQGGGQVVGAAVVYRLPPQDEQSRQDQAKEIAKQLNHGVEVRASDIQVVKVQTAVTLPTACPAFTILLPMIIIMTECMTVYVTGNRGDYFSAVQALDFVGTTQGNTFINVNDLGWAEVADVSFTANTANPVGSSLDDMLNKWQELSGQTVILATVVCHNSTIPQKGVADQAESIRAKIGSAPGGTTTVDLRSVDDSVMFPINCRAFLMILTKLSSE